MFQYNYLMRFEWKFISLLKKYVSLLAEGSTIAIHILLGLHQQITIKQFSNKTI